MARPTLFNHRKFIRLARLLGSRIIAAGVLELMWAPAYESGDDYLGTAQDLADRIGWTESPDVLASALESCGREEGTPGFIEKVQNGTNDANAASRYIIHDLKHHAPAYVSDRAVKEQSRRVPKTCAQCSRTFHAVTSDAVYCSTTCRTSAFRSRRKGAATKANDPKNDAQRGANATERLETKENGTPAPAPALALAPPQKTEKGHPPIDVWVREFAETIFHPKGRRRWQIVQHAFVAAILDIAEKFTNGDQWAAWEWMKAKHAEHMKSAAWRSGVVPSCETWLRTGVYLSDLPEHEQKISPTVVSDTGDRYEGERQRAREKYL